MQRTKLTAGQLSRFHRKRPVASEFTKYEPSGLSHVGCNVEDLLQAVNKVENNRQTQGRASGYVRQPAMITNRQGCERLLKKTEGLCWSWRWTLRAFTVTMEFWHLIIS